MSQENNAKALFAKANPKQTLISHKIKEGYAAPPMQFFTTDDNKQIAYRKIVGNQANAPQLLYIPGFFAGMDLSKTVVVEQYARLNGYTNIRYVGDLLFYYCTFLVSMIFASQLLLSYNYH